MFLLFEEPKNLSITKNLFMGSTGIDMVIHKLSVSMAHTAHLNSTSKRNLCLSTFFDSSVKGH